VNELLREVDYGPITLRAYLNHGYVEIWECNNKDNYRKWDMVVRLDPQRLDKYQQFLTLVNKPS